MKFLLRVGAKVLYGTWPEYDTVASHMLFHVPLGKAAWILSVMGFDSALNGCGDKLNVFISLGYICVCVFVFEQNIWTKI